MHVSDTTNFTDLCIQYTILSIELLHNGGQNLGFIGFYIGFVTSILLIELCTNCHQIWICYTQIYTTVRSSFSKFSIIKASLKGLEKIVFLGLQKMT